MIYVLDTTIIIAALNGRDYALDKLHALTSRGDSFLTTAVNVAEVYAGIRSDEEIRTAAFFKGTHILPIEAGVGLRAGVLKNQLARKGRTVGLDDMIVAAATLEIGATLITENKKDFAFVPGLKLD